MLAFMAIEPFTLRGLVLSVVDALALVACIAPALWLLVVRPLRRLVKERGELLKRTLRAQEEERARLARDLHDEIGQSQTAILLGLRSVASATTLEAARQQAEAVRHMAAEAMESTRRLARGLAPGVLEELGLQAAIDRVCEDLETAGPLKVGRDLRLGAIRLEPSVEIAAYRVVQEALTNAVKHAHATHVQVALWLGDDQLHLRISDNGMGFRELQHGGTSPKHGLGLASMRERVSLLGGEFSIGSAPDGGTELTAWLPLTPSTRS